MEAEVKGRFDKWKKDMTEMVQSLILILNDLGVAKVDVKELYANFRDNIKSNIDYLEEDINDLIELNAEPEEEEEDTGEEEEEGII